MLVLSAHSSRLYTWIIYIVDKYATVRSSITTSLLISHDDFCGGWAKLEVDRHIEFSELEKENQLSSVRRLIPLRWTSHKPHVNTVHYVLPQCWQRLIRSCSVEGYCALIDGPKRKCIIIIIIIIYCKNILAEPILTDRNCKLLHYQVILPLYIYI